ncbi:MAG: GAF domain-containing protein [Deltaproteobacteria bacterium]|nr:GAF domain-containing protein [Deltaproteobacteria bacterium]
MTKTEELALLYEITKALSESLDLRRSLYKVLEILSTSMGMVRGTVTILNPLRNEIGIEVAHGMSRVAMERGKYQVGEGVTGRVIQTGMAFVVPKISQEPLFLDRTATRRILRDQELSFICVPVKKGDQVVGTLSVDRPYDEAYSLKEGERLLSIVATMIAQHVINIESIQLESEKLREENRKDIRRLSTPAIDMLVQYHWPGNVRELENCIERAVLLCEERVIHSYHLPPTLQTGEQSDTVPALSLEEAVASLEREMIIDALKNTHGNMSRAARMLHITERKFTYKTKKYRVDYRTYR